MVFQHCAGQLHKKTAAIKRTDHPTRLKCVADIHAKNKPVKVGNAVVRPFGAPPA